uniref:GrpB family protein n=1 Tax=Eiseniibacteriota bacterium TaxID=2212470 RepID=A0A832I287_UNCEI
MSHVTLVEHRPEWFDPFHAVARELEGPFAGCAARIEHIGGTAVAGLCAKPVLDVLLGVEDLGVIESRAAALVGLGHRHRPEHEAELPERRSFVRAAARLPRIHLRGVVQGGTLWSEHLAFRDALRRDDALAARYAALKREPATLHRDDRAGYTAAKAPFIADVVARVRAEGLWPTNSLK